MKEEFLSEINQLLEKYKIAATAQISKQLLAGITEVPVEIRDIMLLISGIENLVANGISTIQSVSQSEDASSSTAAVATEPATSKQTEEETSESYTNIATEDYYEEASTSYDEEVVVDDVIMPSDIQMADEPVLQNETESYLDRSTPADIEEAPPKEEDVSAQRSGAVIIGGDPVDADTTVAPFVEERSKPASSFVFDKYKIMASHFGVPGASDIELYIAPLIITQNASNVPILVHAYCQGQYKNASSYDIIGNGRNMVTLEIGDFCLLCRGNFDENGVFVSHVLTTGTSANQGDKLQIVSKISGAQTRVQGNGHLKFKDDENTTYEIFPLHIEPDKKAEYVCIKQGPEFLDYFVVGNGYGVPKIRAIDKNQEIIVGWMGSLFEAEII